MSRHSIFRKLVQQPEILVAPGTYDALGARIIEQSGFNSLYLSGAGVAYSLLGRPDIGLVTMTEMVDRAHAICDAVSIPVIADADTGFGNSLNTYRTVREYEKAGISCIQLEDQVMPKRCGHMSGKQLVPVDEMLAKIHAACDARVDSDFCIMARTDAIAVEGFEQALERAAAYREAGADILFIEAPQSEDMMRKLCSQFYDVPLLANMVEGGKTPLKTAAELQELGYSIVIFPGAIARVVSKAVSEFMTHLYKNGTTRDYLDHMFIFDELNTILGLQELRDREKQYTQQA